MSAILCLVLAIQAQGDPWIDRMRMIRNSYEAMGPCSFDSTITTSSVDADGKSSKAWLKIKTFFGNRLNWRVEQVSHSAEKGDEPVGNELWCEMGQIHAYLRTQNPPVAMDLGDMGSFVSSLTTSPSGAWGFAGFPSLNHRLLLGLTDWMQGYGISSDLSQMVTPGTGSSKGPSALKLNSVHWITEEVQGSIAVTHSDPVPLKDWPAAVHFEPPK